MKLVTEMTEQEASNFFLKHESYSNFQLPLYFDFTPLLLAVKVALDAKEGGLNSIGFRTASNYTNVNYILQTNKDGHYAWRPFELIHPALYAHLVSKITEVGHWQVLQHRFEEFSANDKIVCASWPKEAEEENPSDSAEAVSGWWRDVEQQSIIKSIDFKYLFTTDIANFYPSVYTHSISWAIHTKPIAKLPRNRTDFNLLGVNIDKTIQHMRNGQTNGIPQGSVLMDFIAEIIMGYADEQLTEKLKEAEINDYHIIRYRDDYRVFTNSKEDSDAIARHLTLVLQELGLQLNASKTELSEDIILSSIKEDKKDALFMFGKNPWEKTLQKTLLKLVIFSRKHKNSGQLPKLLGHIYKNLESREELKEAVEPIVSIITDIMFNNPRTFASCALVLSSVLRFVDSEDEKLELIEKIKAKFTPVLGTGVLDIWLQRITHSINQDVEYNDALCKVVSEVENIDIWESDWITDNNFKGNVMSTPFIDREKLDTCTAVIDEDEVVLYPYDWGEELENVPEGEPVEF